MKESNRQKKFSRVIQKELSEVFQREVSLPAGSMVTVSIVRTSPDLNLCKVYLSVFPAENREAVFEEVEGSLGSIRHALAQRIRQQVRRIPELMFFLDDTLDYVDKMDRIFASIKQDEEE
ncbi:MAG: 30S ribosome-binding factor RbfA [Bacteroidia bacterium]|nr:30S ribosome-binding factor RbfA [Bacteroidia bacterium]